MYRFELVQVPRLAYASEQGIEFSSFDSLLFLAVQNRPRVTEALFIADKAPERRFSVVKTWITAALVSELLIDG